MTTPTNPVSLTAQARAKALDNIRREIYKGPTIDRGYQIITRYAINATLELVEQEARRRAENEGRIADEARRPDDVTLLCAGRRQALELLAEFCRTQREGH